MYYGQHGHSCDSIKHSYIFSDLLSSNQQLHPSLNAIFLKIEPSHLWVQANGRLHLESEDDYSSNIWHMLYGQTHMCKVKTINPMEQSWGREEYMLYTYSNVHHCCLRSHHLHHTAIATGYSGRSHNGIPVPNSSCLLLRKNAILKSEKLDML